MNRKIDEQELVWLCGLRYSNVRISKILNVSVSAVQRAKKRNDLPRNYKIDEQEFIQLFPITKSKILAERYNCHIQYITKMAHTLGLKKARKPKPLKVKKTKQPKVKKVVIPKIKKEPKRIRKIDYKEFLEIYPTMKNIEIAEKYHCSRVRVSQVAKLLGLKSKRCEKAIKIDKPKIKKVKTIKPKNIIVTTRIVKRKPKNETQSKRIITDAHILELLARAKQVEARQSLILN